MRTQPFMSLFFALFAACGADVHDRKDDPMSEQTFPLAQDAGDRYNECSGPPYGQGTCEEGQICARMPYVAFSYCMLRPPCEEGLVEIMHVACAHACQEASDCAKYQLSRCASNVLTDSTGEPRGWCTP